MENYTYNSSYPESGDSSPRSREIEFENPPPWEENQPPSNYKVKFMCSYGGKIHPRPHDNQLSYVGGETKILSVDRNIKFGSLLAKLIGLCDSENISFKYQLPGEDLDALISVTNDDDLEHMMHEYERLYRISPKPARLRIFIFPTLNQSLSSSTRSFGSADEGRSEKDRFVEALNSAPIMTTPPQSASPAAAQPQPVTSNVDFLFGLEKSNAMMAAQAPAQRQVMGRVPDSEDPVFVPGSDERFVGLDPIQKHIQDLQGLQRLRLEEQQGLQRMRLEEQQGLQRIRFEEQEGIHRRKSEDNIPVGGYGGGEYYKAGPEKAPQAAVIHGGVPYSGGVIPASGVNNNEQAVYMMPAPGNVYHSPMVRPMAAAPGQGFYTVQRLPSEMYRDQQQQMYNTMIQQQQQSAMSSMAAAPPALQPQKAAGYSEGYAMVRPGTTGGVGVVAEGGYGQMAYDGGMGRQVIYTTPGGVMAAPPQVQAAAQYQAMAGGVNADMRQGGALNQEGAGGFKGVQKVTQGSL